MNFDKDFFDTGVCEKIGYYVYRLLDGNETFYIGKGKGNRVFHHETSAFSEKKQTLTKKDERIKAAITNGTFNIIIHRHGLSEEQAFLLESALIDMHLSYGFQLTNIQQGHRQNLYGSCSPEQLSLSYSTPKTLITKVSKDTPSNTLLISINSSWSQGEQTPSSILKMVQYCWRIREPNLNDIPYVFAVANKIVRGVYQIERWLKSDDQEWFNVKGFNRPELISGRYGFVGSLAPKDVWNKYVNTELPTSVTFGSGQPILYAHRVMID